MNKQDQNNKGFMIVGLSLAAVAIGMAVLFLFAHDVTLAFSAVIAGVVCAMLPFMLHSIQKLTVGPVGIETREAGGTIVAATSALQDIDLYLEGRGNITAPEIMEKLEALNQRHFDLIYQYMDSWRTQQVFRIINIKGDEKLRIGMQKKLSRLLPLFEALIIIANGQDYDKNLHYYYSSLAYVYKDMEPRDWDKAYENINFAIACFREKGTFTIYEFNRLICAINKKHLSGKQRDQMHKDFEVVINAQSTAWMLAEEKTAEIIAPGLQKWIEDNKGYWERANPGKTRPAKKKWVFGNRHSDAPLADE